MQSLAEVETDFEIYETRLFLFWKNYKVDFALAKM